MMHMTTSKYYLNMKATCFLVLLFFVAGFCVKAQGNAAQSVLVWKSSVTIINGTSYTMAGTITSDPGHGIISFEKNNRTKSFFIVSIEGTWTDTSVPGRILFHTSVGDENADIVFERTDHDISVVITVDADNTRKLMIDTITSL